MNVGGIVGASYGHVEECYNTGKIKGSSSSTGAIVGTHSGTTIKNATLNNNYNTGDIVNASNTTNYSGIAGMAGQAGGEKIIKYNYTIGSSANDFGRLIDDTVYEGNYALSGKVATIQKSTELTDAQMQDLNNFEGFDPSVWTIGVTEGYPYPTLINNPHKAAESAPIPVLQTPSGIQVTEKDGDYILTFTGDSSAVKHLIYITGADPIETTALSVNITSVFAEAGDYKIGIISLGDGVNYQDSMPSETITYKVVKEKILTAPSDLMVTEEEGVYTVSFTGDFNALKHKITVDGYESVFETSDGKTQKADITAAFTEFREYTIRIVSIGDGKKYLDSEEASIRYTVVDKTILSAPTDVAVTWGGETETEDIYTLTFTPGNSADFHEISLLKEGETEPVVISNVTASSVNLNDYVLGTEKEKAGSYTITVSAKKEDAAENASPIVIDSRFAGTRSEAEESYQLIGCLRHLKNIAADGKYIVINDITEPVTEPLPEFNGVLIGEQTDAVTHRKIAIDINLPDTTELRSDGLFTAVNGAVVKNIGITGTLISGGSKGKVGGFTGGLAGDTGDAETLIENCFNEASIKKGVVDGGFMGVGGLLGTTQVNTTVKDCFNTGTVESGTDNTGGVTGYGRGQIYNCYNTGRIYGNEQSGSVGGVIGASYEEIVEDCWNTGEVLCDNMHVGGIAGTKATTHSVVRNCFNTGKIFAKAENAGGILGREYNAKNGKVTIENCYNSGAISAETKLNTAGGLVGALGHTAAGRPNLLDIKNSYTVTENGLGAVGVKNHEEHTLTLENTYYVSDAADALEESLAGKKISTSDMKEGLPTGFDTAVWTYEIGFEYPQLISNPHVGGSSPSMPEIDLPAPTNMWVRSTGEGRVWILDFEIPDGIDEYQLSVLKEGESTPQTRTGTAVDLYNIEDMLTLPDTKYTVSVRGIKDGGLGKSASILVDTRFGGARIVDGVTYQLISSEQQFNNIKSDMSGNYMQWSDIYFEEEFSDLYTQAGAVPFTGRYIGSGTDRKAIYLEINGGRNLSVFGVLGAGALIENIRVEGTLTASDKNVGAIAGEVQGNAVIRDCENAAIVKNGGKALAGDANIGGIAGVTSAESSIENCVNSGGVASSSTNVGGIVGYASGTVKDCTNLGVVENTFADYTGTTGNTGGIVGYSATASAAVSGCSNHGMLEVYFPAGTPNEKLVLYTGGIVGNARGDVSSCNNNSGSFLRTNLADGAVMGTSNALMTGGIAGYLYTDNTVSDCHNYGWFMTVTDGTAGGNQAWVGGIVGSNYGNIITSSNHLSMDTATARMVGGIVGRHSGGTISECYNDGRIWTAGYSGGIASRVDNSARIENCYNIAQISGSNSGGLVGTGTAVIENCYSHQPEQPNSYAIMRNPGSTTASNTYYLTHEGIKLSLGESENPLTAETAVQQESYAGFAFDTVWTIEENAGYPTLRENTGKNDTISDAIELKGIMVVTSVGIKNSYNGNSAILLNGYVNRKLVSILVPGSANIKDVSGNALSGYNFAKGDVIQYQADFNCEASEINVLFTDEQIKGISPITNSNPDYQDEGVFVYADHVYDIRGKNVYFIDPEDRSGSNCAIVFMSGETGDLPCVTVRVENGEIRAFYENSWYTDVDTDRLSGSSNTDKLIIVKKDGIPVIAIIVTDGTY